MYRGSKYQSSCNAAGWEERRRTYDRPLALQAIRIANSEQRHGIFSHPDRGGLCMHAPMDCGVDRRPHVCCARFHPLLQGPNNPRPDRDRIDSVESTANRPGGHALPLAPYHVCLRAHTGTRRAGMALSPDTGGGSLPADSAEAGTAARRDGRRPGRAHPGLGCWLPTAECVYQTRCLCWKPLRVG